MTTEDIIAELAIIFIAAKVAGALFERLRQPAVIGELLVGVLLGPHLLDIIGTSQTHELFQELGAIILLFAVGLDTPLSHLQAVGGRSLAVGVAGVILPFAAGAALLWATGHTRNESLFMGTALVATSVGITARVLADMGRIRESESRVILGAAVVDDVLGLIILAVVSGSVAGELSVDSIAWLALLAIAFVVLVGGLGSRLVQRAIPSLDRLGEAGVFVVAMGVCLSLAAVAGALELAAFIGAFLAGMAFAETRDRYRLEANVGIVYIFLVPFFFVITGTNVDLDVFTQGDTAALTVGVILVAVAGKLLGCGVAASRMGRRSALIVGTGMVPRGEVGILVASLGLSRGVIGLDLYGVVVAMSVGTTLLVPPVLVALFKGRPAGPPVPRRHTGEIEGIGG